MKKNKIKQFITVVSGAAAVMTFVVGCNGGSGASNQGTTQPEYTSFAIEDANDLVIPEYEDMDFSWADHPLSLGELYDLDESKYKSYVYDNYTESAAALLMKETLDEYNNLSESERAFIEEHNSQETKKSLKLTGVKSTYILCSGVPRLNEITPATPLGIPVDVSGQHPEIFKPDLNPIGYVLRGYMSDNSGKRNAKVKIREPKTSVWDNNAHLVYYIDDSNWSHEKILEQCKRTLANEFTQWQKWAKYKVNTSVQIDSVVAKARNNSAGYEHPLLDLRENSGNKNRFSTIVSFGDSLSDTDATYNFLQKVIPSTKTWYFGHFTNGWTWPEYAADTLGAMPYNEAWGGAGVNKQPLKNIFWEEYNVRQKLLGAYLPALNAEVDYYHQRVTEEAARNPDKTLYTFLIGGNDFVNYGETAHTVYFGIRTSVINLIQNNGGKNIVILNLPDVTSAPIFKTDKAKIKQEVYNKTLQLDQMLPQLVTELNGLYSSRGVHITLFDTKTLFNAVIADPKKYYINNATDACLIKPDTAYFFDSARRQDCDGWNYVFWDTLHPTTRIHQILGVEFANFVKQNYK